MSELSTLRAHWAAADPATRRFGRDWYARANAEARRLAKLSPDGIGTVRAAGIVAALSPRAHWAVNLRWAEAICRAARAGDPCPAVHTRDARAKAWRIANGEHPAAVLGGPKVRAFWRAIAGDPQSVTIDVWAARAAGADPAKLDRVGAYDAVAESYRALGAILRVPPRDLQAVIWQQVRGRKPADPAHFSVRRER